MAESIIKGEAPPFIYKTYSCSYSIGGFEHKYLSASSFGITAIPGYTIVGAYSWTSGDYETNVIQIDCTTSGTVMGIFRKPNSSDSATAYVSYLWVRSDLAL